MKTLKINLKNVSCYKSGNDLVVNITNENVSVGELVASSLPKDLKNFENFFASLEISVSIPEEEVSINSDYDFPEEVSNEECCISRTEEENQ